MPSNLNSKETQSPPTTNPPVKPYMATPPSTPTVPVPVAPVISPRRIFTREVRAAILTHNTFRAQLFNARVRGRYRGMIGVSFYQHAVLERGLGLGLRWGDGEAQGKREGFPGFGRLSTMEGEVETIE